MNKQEQRKDFFKRNKVDETESQKQHRENVVRQMIEHKYGYQKKTGDLSENGREER